MDMIEKLQDIFDGAIKIEGKLIEDIKYFIVYFIHDNDIVFIGKTSNVLEYVNERKEKYSASHYYLEEIDANIIDNYFAQLILEIQPVFNSRIPNNTKYISHHIAKKDYFVYKPEFRKVFDEHGGYMYKNSLFIEKKIFDDVFARIPHNQDMPRIKRIILLVEDYKNLQLVQTGGMIEDTLYDISGNKVTALRDYKPDFPGEYKKIKTLEEKQYEVVNVIDSETFEALNYNTGKKVILQANDKLNSIYFIDPDVNYEGKWIFDIDNFHVDYIRREYFELLEENQEA